MTPVLARTLERRSRRPRKQRDPCQGDTGTQPALSGMNPLEPAVNPGGLDACCSWEGRAHRVRGGIIVKLLLFVAAASSAPGAAALAGPSGGVAQVPSAAFESARLPAELADFLPVKLPAAQRT